MFLGVGYGMVVVSAWVAIYYNVIITYTIYYMFMSMTSSLPWIGCNHEWNTPFCSELVEDCRASNGIMMNNTCYDSMQNMTADQLEFYNVTVDENGTYSFTDPFPESRRRPSEEFYR